MINPVEKLRLISQEHGVEHFTKYVLDDPDFALWSGSSKEYQHHYGKGGLAKHTLEVTELCLLNNKYLGEQVEPYHAVLAAIFHDCGKMEDYRAVDDTYNIWEATDHKYKIHHITRSAIFWNQICALTGVDQNTCDEVTHAILAHHGLREWGSPVQPRTKLAWLLHISDNMSARMDDGERWFNERTRNTN